MSHRRTLQVDTRVEKGEDKRKEIREMFELRMKPTENEAVEDGIHKNIYEL